MKLMSDKTTMLEATLWANEVTYENGTSVQYSLSLSRSWKGDNGWTKQERPSYRLYDIPILSFLVSKAHAWALEQRAEVTPF